MSGDLDDCAITNIEYQLFNQPQPRHRHIDQDVRQRAMLYPTDGAWQSETSSLQITLEIHVNYVNVC